MQSFRRFLSYFVLLVLINSSILCEDDCDDYYIIERYFYYYVVEHFDRFEPGMAGTEIVDLKNNNKFSIDSVYINFTYSLVGHYVRLQYDDETIFSDTVKFNKNDILLKDDIVVYNKLGSKLKIKVDSSKLLEIYIGEAPFIDIFIEEEKKEIKILGSNKLEGFKIKGDE